MMPNCYFFIIKFNDRMMHITVQEGKSVCERVRLNDTTHALKKWVSKIGVFQDWAFFRISPALLYICCLQPFFLMEK